MNIEAICSPILGANRIWNAPHVRYIYNRELTHLHTRYLIFVKLIQGQSDINSQLCGERDDREALPGGQTLFPVDEERVGLDLEVVFQTALVHQ